MLHTSHHRRVVQLLQLGQRKLEAQLVVGARRAGVAPQVHAAEGGPLAGQRRLHLIQALQLVVVGPQVGQLRVWPKGGGGTGAW